jgi:hypothetical protein
VVTRPWIIFLIIAVELAVIIKIIRLMRKLTDENFYSMSLLLLVGEKML